MWIEIYLSLPLLNSILSQPARAVWIEIGYVDLDRTERDCHSLRGLCGLKFSQHHIVDVMVVSQPARAVWIEISMAVDMLGSAMSQPARAVWIEISIRIALSSHSPVTACEGCVD